MTEYQTFIAAIGQMPAGSARWWLEEVLLRGTPEGTIAGAHVIIGAELTDPLGGKTRTIKGPYPLDALSVLTGQSATDWQSVLGATLTAQQATIVSLNDQHDADALQITAITNDRDTANATVAARDATIAALQAQIAALQTPQS